MYGKKMKCLCKLKSISAAKDTLSSLFDAQFEYCKFEL